jgi:AcrR family transcriptional regulator
MSNTQRGAAARLSVEALRRQELIDAALRTISSRGFDRTTIRDIAAAAGASNGSVHYYFETKEALLRTAVAESDSRFRERVRTELAHVAGAAEKLKRIAGLCFPDDIDEEPDWAVFIDFWQQAVRDEAFRSIFEAANVDWLELIAAIIVDGVESGELAIRQEPVEEAMTLAALIDGFALHSRVTDHVTHVIAREALKTRIDGLCASDRDTPPSGGEGGSVQ